MNPFDRAIDFVLGYEGGLTDDPEDKGGLTKFGISQSSYPNLDIRNLDRKQAVVIYYSDFWQRCKCDQMPSPIAIVLFDSAVNQGPMQAIRLLQKALNVTADGMIGAETIAASFRVNVHVLVAEFIARRAFQYALHPQVSKYGLGWMRRLANCHQIALEPL